MQALALYAVPADSLPNVGQDWATVLRPSQHKIVIGLHHGRLGNPQVAQGHSGIGMVQDLRNLLDGHPGVIEGLAAGFAHGMGIEVQAEGIADVLQRPGHRIPADGFIPRPVAMDLEQPGIAGIRLPPSLDDLQRHRVQAQGFRLAGLLLDQVDFTAGGIELVVAQCQEIADSQRQV